MNRNEIVERIMRVADSLGSVAGASGVSVSISDVAPTSYDTLLITAKSVHMPTAQATGSINIVSLGATSVSNAITSITASVTAAINTVTGVTGA